MNILRQKSWSPYVVGVGIGILSWFAFATASHGLGITTAFEYMAALASRALAPAVQDHNAYFDTHSPKVGWEWMVVIGVLLGSFVSSKMSADRSHPTIPALWRQRFGDSVGLRMAFAFAGGMVMMIGARLARGCTSGHGITGALQFAVSSWIFVAAAFGTGIAVALALFGRPKFRETHNV